MLKRDLKNAIHIYMNNIELAKKFAARKFSEANVQNHFLEVYDLLKDFGVKDENILVAGLLHDVLEDTNTTDEEIPKKFGQGKLGTRGVPPKKLDRSDETGNDQRGFDVGIL